MTYTKVKNAVLTPTAVQQLEELQEGENRNLLDHITALDELFEFVFNANNEPDPSPRRILEMMQDVRELRLVLCNLQAPKKQ